MAKARHTENITELANEQLKKTLKTKIKSRNRESTKIPETKLTEISTKANIPPSDDGIFSKMSMWVFVF